MMTQAPTTLVMMILAVLLFLNKNCFKDKTILFFNLNFYIQGYFWTSRQITL